MGAFPTIRLDLEGLRYQVVHAMAVHNVEVQENVDKALAEIIKNFDFKGLIEAAVRSELQRSITSAVSDAVKRIVWDEKVREAIAGSVRESIVEAAENERQAFERSGF